MANPTIKFSHAYTKLLTDGCDVNGHWVKHPVKTAKLLQVVPIEISTLSKTFIDYDTDNGKYKLAYSGYYVMLIFQKPFGDLFTTLRPMFGKFGNKQTYYDKLVGMEFNVVIAP